MTNLQPKDTVRTEDRAIELLRLNNSYDGHKHKTGTCECGETNAITSYDSDFNSLSYVLVCESCGDDDALNDEVLNDY
ncbi:hypothetical protein AUW17_05420 [Tenacibaculum dicentrarchi]|nr:hypothetical protein AUW17_05420 [Tenacibaculum dicentrarchi]